MRSLALCLALVAGATGAVRDVEGVRVPESSVVDGAELTLNGVGLRRATIFNVKVYVGALYVTTPSKDPEAIVRADEPKSVRMRFVRDVGKGKVMEAFREGFEKNGGAAAKALEPGLERVATTIPDEMKSGMELDVSYAPGKGTTVTGPQGRVVVEGKPFAEAMLRCWLGPHPADDGLKNAMLAR